MKKLFCLLAILFSINTCFALSEDYHVLRDQSLAFYSPSSQTWSSEQIYDDSIVINKKLYEGTGAYSVYNYSDGSLAFALATGDEFIYNGNFIIVDNNLLKFSKLVYNFGSFQEEQLSEEEIQSIFPDIEIIKVSWFDEDNMMWLHKPLKKDKTILLLNDTDRFFHRFECKSKNSQDEDIKNLITFSRYGMYKFKHFGERNGKIVFLIR